MLATENRHIRLIACTGLRSAWSGEPDLSEVHAPLPAVELHERKARPGCSRSPCTLSQSLLTRSSLHAVGLPHHRQDAILRRLRQLGPNSYDLCQIAVRARVQYT